MGFFTFKVEGEGSRALSSKKVRENYRLEERKAKEHTEHSLVVWCCTELFEDDTDRFKDESVELINLSRLLDAESEHHLSLHVPMRD